MAVEQLDDAGRLAERADPLLDPVAVRRVDHPDASAAAHRVAGALHPARLRMDPAEREVELVAEADRRHRAGGASPTWIAPAISAIARCAAVEMLTSPMKPWVMPRWRRSVVGTPASRRRAA